MSNTTEARQSNILLLTTYAHGGAGVACRRLSAALQKQQQNAQVMTQADLGGRFNFIAERLTFLPWERDKSVRFSFSLANFGHDISRHPLVQQADVLHLHWWNQGFLSLKNLAALGTLKKKMVWTLHDMWAFTGGCHYDWGCGRYTESCGRCPYLRFQFPGDLSHRVWARKKRLLPPNIDIVTCSRWLADKARSSSLLRDYNITDIPNPIDTGQFQPMSQEGKLAFRAKIGLPADTKLILFAAMNIKNPFKGFVHFKEAIHFLGRQADLGQVAIVVVGKSQPEDFEGMPFPVIQLGLIQDPAEMASIYAAVDVFVIPSLEENLPNTIMESLASGTPVVGFQVGGIPEMIEDGISGKVTPVKDSRQMAADIAWVLGDEHRRKTLAANARQKVLNNYSENVVASRYLEVYRQ